jgi:hypothetical protein
LLKPYEAAAGDVLTTTVVVYSQNGLHMIVYFVGWSEPAATNTPVEDEVVQAILVMNQKPILFP